MIIDAHAHVFPHMGTAAGYESVPRHLMQQQNKMASFWGRMVTSTLDEQYVPDPEEEVGFRIGKYGRYYWTKRGKECWLQRFPTMMVEMEWPPEHLIVFMDAAGVDQAVLQSGYMEMNFNRIYFERCLRQWPDRFVGTFSVDYDIGGDERHREAELEKIRDAVLRGGMKGVLDQSKGRPVDDDRFTPLWAELSRLGIPYIFALGFQPRGAYLEMIDRIERVLRRFPDLKGIIGHLGGNIRSPGDPDFTDSKELWKLLRLPNLYFEVGYVLAYENWEFWKEDYEYPYPRHNRLIRMIYDEFGAGRLLWGSDMPNIYRTCTYRQGLDLVRLHFEFMNEAEKGQVLGGNAARLFQIECPLAEADPIPIRISGTGH